MLLDNDVMADREAKAGTLASWLRREERIEQLFPDLGRNAGAVVANNSRRVGALSIRGARTR
jgi:hypothetical protein